MTPHILIPSPTTHDAEYNQRCWPEYASAVRGAGGEAILLPLTASAAEFSALLQKAHGVLLPGSPADVDPSRYGHSREPECAQADIAREATDWSLLEAVARQGLPLLAICFGLQALNVYRGGTLVQHLPGIPINHAAGPQVSVAHGILIKPGSVLAHLGSAEVSGQAGEAEISKDQPTLSSPALRLSINSSHHQAIGALGAGLQVTARSATDDVVESIESAETGPFLLGLQWHPERSIEQSPLSRAIFARFIEEASDYAGLVRARGSDR